MDDVKEPWTGLNLIEMWRGARGQCGLEKACMSVFAPMDLVGWDSNFNIQEEKLH